MNLSTRFAPGRVEHWARSLKLQIVFAAFESELDKN